MLERYSEATSGINYTKKLKSHLVTSVGT